MSLVFLSPPCSVLYPEEHESSLVCTMTLRYGNYHLKESKRDQSLLLLSYSLPNRGINKVAQTA